MIFLHKNRHILKFDKEAVETYDKHFMSNGSALVMTTGKENPAEYAPEIAYILNSFDPFFKEGDKVLVMYDCFIRGKHPELAQWEEKRIIGQQDGEDVYWAYKNEVVAKFEIIDGEETIIPKPGYVSTTDAFLEKPMTHQKIGSLYVPASVLHDELEQRKKKPYWTTVVGSGIAYIPCGTDIMVPPISYIPFKYKDLHFFSEENILLKKE